MVYLHEDGDHVGSQLEIARSHKGWKDWRARKDTYKLRWLHRGKYCLQPRSPRFKFDKRAGWTLQELLAPHNVLFFAGEWEYIGSRSSLARDLQAMTGINYEHIRDGYVHSNEVLVSERLSWAVGRETTREEDHAYSLMVSRTLRQDLLRAIRASATRKNLYIRVFLGSICLLSMAKEPKTRYIDCRLRFSQQPETIQSLPGICELMVTLRNIC